MIIRLTWSKCILFALVGCLIAGAVSCDNRSPANNTCAPWQVDHGYSHQTAYILGDPHLNELQNYFKPTLETNRKEFVARQTVKGFGAGSGYPQIWLRDSATIIPASRFYYSREYLQSWLEEHLSYQQPDGQLYDWFAAGPRSSFAAAAPQAKEGFRSHNQQTTITVDKNSTESDQETSAIDAAWQVFKVSGDREWLNKSIEGRSLISRLNAALEFLFKYKLDNEHGLITSAFTADWGDVSPIYPDQRAIYLDSKTPLVVGIYTNALVYRAALQMEELNLAAGDETAATKCRSQAELIRNNVNKHLWQDDRGFFRLHLLLNPTLFKTDDAEPGRFALGGNAVAILCRLADDSQAHSIFRVAEERRRQYQLSTISGSLTPPYPRGFFKHPAVSEEYTYQNGGQWDWFGGRFVLAEFERGRSVEALKSLKEIAQKVSSNKGLYEWNTRTGEGKGSKDYAGNAGVLAAAVFQGLFGVYLDAATLNLHVRLGEQPGQIHLYEPASDRFIAYRYCYDIAAQTITLEYESNFPEAGVIRILIPNGRKVTEVQLDASKRDFGSERVGENSVAVVNTDWRRHTLQLQLTR